MHKYEIRARQLKDEMQKILDDNKVSSQLGLEEVNQEQFVIYKRLEFELYHLKRIIDFKNELKEKNRSHDNRGGIRDGAGRKLDTGMKTTTVRVPVSMKTFILSFVDLYAEWLKEDEDQILKRKTDDSQIIRTVQLLEVLASLGRKKFSGRKKNHEEK